jgi:hypothetical protein
MALVRSRQTDGWILESRWSSVSARVAAAAAEKRSAATATTTPPLPERLIRKTVGSSNGYRKVPIANTLSAISISIR